MLQITIELSKEVHRQNDWTQVAKHYLETFLVTKIELGLLCRSNDKAAKNLRDDLKGRRKSR